SIPLACSLWPISTKQDALNPCRSKDLSRSPTRSIRFRRRIDGSLVQGFFQLLIEALDQPRDIPAPRSLLSLGGKDRLRLAEGGAKFVIDDHIIIFAPARDFAPRRRQPSA